MPSSRQAREIAELIGAEQVARIEAEAARGAGTCRDCGNPADAATEPASVVLLIAPPDLHHWGEAVRVDQVDKALQAGQLVGCLTPIEVGSRPRPIQPGSAPWPAVPGLAGSGKQLRRETRWCIASGVTGAQSNRPHDHQQPRPQAPSSQVPQRPPLPGLGQVQPQQPVQPPLPSQRPPQSGQVSPAPQHPLPDPLSVMPLPTRPASRHVPQHRPAPATRAWKQFAWIAELVMALPWLWWSWLSIQFVGIPSETVYRVVLTLALLSGVGIFFHQFETFLAKKWWRLREPSDLELKRMAPAWLSVCQAAGVNPNSYRVWIHEGPETTAPITVGRTIVLTNWSLYTLPQRNLEAVFAHELAHHLPLPRLVSLFLYWLSLPARAMGVVLAAGLKHSAFKTLIRIVIGFFTVGVFVLGYVTQFDYFTVMMLSPWAAPLVLPWLARQGEDIADRTAADLGYGHPLSEIFAQREFDRARSGWRPQRFGLGDSQPIETARQRMLDKYLKKVAESTHQPYRIDNA